MNAIEETSAAAEVGKDTGDGTQPSAGASTQALAVFPHLPYGDAVFAELAATSYAPQFVEAGVGQGAHSVLFLRLVWLPGALVLDEVARADGLTLRWSHVSGWSAHTAYDSRVLPVDPFAEPVLIADAAQHFAKRGLASEWVCPFEARWEHAHALDVALAAFEDRGVSW